MATEIAKLCTLGGGMVVGGGGEALHHVQFKGRSAASAPSIQAVVISTKQGKTKKVFKKKCSGAELVNFCNN